MKEPESETDRPASPESGGLLLHVVDEMPPRVIFAVAFVAFFFAWGAVNNVIALFRNEGAAIDHRYGLALGVIAGLGIPFAIWLVKRRAR